MTTEHATSDEPSKATVIPRPTSFVRMFQERFAAAVRDGKKRQTIRPMPKRIPRRGDLLRARRWIGKPFRSKQETLIEATIIKVETITIYLGSVEIGVGSEYRHLTIGINGDAMDGFAKADGFEDWEELHRWFCDNHELPFSGVVIYW